jgi:phosphatidylinositol kinase/protein kinase (PI-3  family)
VLRANKEVLLTIMEVFIHDPLYMWALTTAGASKRQLDEQDDAVAMTAASRLSVVRRDGREREERGGSFAACGS